MERFTNSDLNILCEKAGVFENKNYISKDGFHLDGKTMATVFFESCPESFLALSSAMIRLGGHVINIKEEELEPDDSFEDVIYQVSQYVDVVVACDDNSEIKFFKQQNGLITRMSDEDLYQNRR